MKNLFISFTCILVSAFAFGQSVLLTPQSISSAQNSTVENIKLRGTTAIDIIGVRHNGTLPSPSATGLGNYLLALQGQGHDGSAFSTSKATISLYATQTWNTTSNGTGIEFINTPNGSTTPSRRMLINENGFIGMGLGSNLPTSNLHIHELNSSSLSKIKLTNFGSGITDSDGLDISLFSSGDLLSLGASIINKENAALFLGSNGITRMTIAANGNVGVNGLLNNAGVGKFNVWHDTGNNNLTPTLNLKNTNDASNGIIRMENFAGTRFFGQYFNVSSTTPANNFISFDYNGTQPILDLAGNGNVQVAGYTKLGGSAAPSIKMLKLTLTNGATGIATPIAHGLTQSKILSVSVLINASTGNDIPPRSTYLGFEYDFFVSPSNIFIKNVSGNDANIIGRPVRILVTYEE